MLFKQIRSRLYRSRWRPSLTVVLLTLWILFIIYGTTLPFEFSASQQDVQERLRDLWEHPIKRGGLRADAVSNVLLFIPFGFLLASWRAGRGAAFPITVILATLSGALLSGSVEFAQLFSLSRFTSVLDLLTNTLGSAAGTVIGWIWTRWLWPIVSVRIRQMLLARPLKVCAVAAALGMVIAGMAPLRTFPTGPTSLSQASILGRDLLTWVLAGGLFILAARESGRRDTRALVSAMAVAGGLCLLIETARALILGRDADIASLVLALLGAGIGVATVARSASGNERRWTAPAIFVWCLVLVLTAWNPWSFEWPKPPYLRLERVVPFWSYFFSRSAADLADVTGTALFFLPLGALLAARSWRQSLLGSILIGLGFAFVLELGQVFLPGRSADISDVISAAAGTGLGLALWRWGESARTTSLGVARYRVHPRTGRLV